MNIELLRVRRYQLCGKSRATNVIIDADELALLVKRELLRAHIKQLQKELAVLDIIT
jgi:ERCC4-type nuclease